MMAAKPVGWMPIAAAKMASLRGETHYKSASFNLTLLVQEAGSLEVDFLGSQAVRGIITRETLRDHAADVVN
jgi:hypothetical protein